MCRYQLISHHRCLIFESEETSSDTLACMRSCTWHMQLPWLELLARESYLHKSQL